MDVTLKDGSVTCFEFSNYSVRDAHQSFSFDESRLGADITVTDLR